jgi:hypothetical protein
MPTVPGVDILRTDLSESGPTGGLGALRARLAHAVIADPATLPAALAALLGAEIATDTKRIDLPTSTRSRPHPADSFALERTPHPPPAR